MSQLTVSISPHIHSRRSTRSIMLDVLIALAPAAVASIIIFGIRSLFLMAAGVCSAVLAEFIFNKIVKKDCTVGDLSAAVTGLILALNVPASLPIWQIVIGAAIAVVVVKGLFGGIGHNFANPAITARIVMILSFTSTMSTVSVPRGYENDAISSASPLAVMRGAEGALPSIKNMLLGLRTGTAMGETCAVALVLGGIYLLARRVISWHTPVTYIATVALLTFIFGRDPLYHVLSGGLLLGSIFMATDYATTPSTPWGKVIFGFGCGLITVMIRLFGVYPEGVSFSILFMNVLTPQIEKWTATKPLGGVKA